MTRRIEDAVFAEIEKIDAMGGALAAIQTGYFQRELAREQFERNRALETGDAQARGREPRRARRARSARSSIFRLDRQRAAPDRAAARGARASATPARSPRRSSRCARPPRATENLVPPILEAVKLYATQGEICDVLREVFGTYTRTR